MSNEIAEALLELHYHRAIVDMFAAVLGARFLRMLKPSTLREGWVGFDQGWVRTALSTEDLYNELSNAIKSGGTNVDGFYLGYFLQFKVVHSLSRRSKLSPTGFIAPYLRSEVDVEPNKVSGLSQHELLTRLATIDGALVYYACPLLFDPDKIYEYPDLDSLRIADVSSAPASILAGGRHFIAYQDPSVIEPTWCSEPHPGRGQRGSEWIRDEASRPRSRTGPEMLDLIGRARSVLSETLDERTRNLRRASLRLPQSLTVLLFSRR